MIDQNGNDKKQRRYHPDDEEFVAECDDVVDVEMDFLTIFEKQADKNKGASHGDQIS